MKNIWQYYLNLHADYPLKIGKKQSLSFIIDVFNIANSQQYTYLDMSYEYPEPGTLNPDYKVPMYFQSPRQIRFGLNYGF